jgi:hypothetical protein
LLWRPIYTLDAANCQVRITIKCPVKSAEIASLILIFVLLAIFKPPVAALSEKAGWKKSGCSL